MATWGATTINIEIGSYRPPTAAASVIENQLLAGADLSAVASVIQQGGRLRKRISLRSKCSWAGYQTLYNDHVAGTARNFTGSEAGAAALSCYIESLSPPTLLPGNALVAYGMTLVEA